MDYPRYTTASDCDGREIPSFIEAKSGYGPRRIIDDSTKPKRLFDEDSESSDEPDLVQVYLRLKPCKDESDLYHVKNDKSLITSLDTATAGHGRRTQHNVSKMYKFSHIFGPKATQKQIFEHVVKDNLTKLSEGHSFTLMTYGASGSGKTYTLMGTVAAPGLVPRSLEYVFKIIDAAQQPVYKPADGGAEKLSNSLQDFEMRFVKTLRQVSAPLRDKYRRMSARLSKEMSLMDVTNRTQYYVWVSFVEIYNEAVYDLLVSSDRRASTKLRIREDPSGLVYVKGATQAFVRSGEEAYDVMVAGKHNLQVAATGVHAHSSRSHCIFTITLLAQSESGVRVSCVRLCDLAGCERAARARVGGARLAESRAINSSLHVLEKCLHALRRNQRAAGDANLVPYRESKLTRLLGGGLSGSRGEALSMVVTINPQPGDWHETKHVLQLANVAKDIQINNTIEETWMEGSSQDSTVCSSAEVMRLRAENERLHYELAQSHAQYKRLLAETEEHRQQAASRMKQMVTEAKEFTGEFYKSMIANMEQRHRSEVRELIEEYESKLQAAGISCNTVTTRVKQRLMSDKFSQSPILDRDDVSGQIAELSLQSHNRTLTDDNLSTDTENRDSVTILSDNYQSDDEANESLEPNFILQRDLETITHLHERSDKNVAVDDDNGPKSDVTDSATDTLNESEDSGEESNLIEDSTSFATAENSNNTTGGVNNSNHTKSRNNSDINVSKDDKNNSSDKRGTYVVHNVSNFVPVKEVNAINTIPEDDCEEKITSIQEKGAIKEKLTDISTNSLKKAEESSVRESLEAFEQMERDIKTNLSVPNTKVTVPSPASKVNKEPIAFFFNDETKKNKSHNEKSKTQDTSTDDTLKAFVNKDINIAVNNQIVKDIVKIPQTNATDKIFSEIKIKTEPIDIIDKPNTIDYLKSNIALDERSPSIIKEETPENYDSTRIKLLLGESSILNTPTKNNSVDVFDEVSSPDPVTTIKKKAVNTLQKNMQKINLEDLKIDVDKSKKEDKEVADLNEVTKPIIEVSDANMTSNKSATEKASDTADEFENIYKDLSQSRAGEFDLLLTQELSKTSINDDKNNCDMLNIESAVNEIANLNLKPIENKETNKEHETISNADNDPKCDVENDNKKSNDDKPLSKEDIDKKPETTDEPQPKQTRTEPQTKTKYRLRNKQNELEAEDQEFQKIKESITKPLRRNLRLRRQKNVAGAECNENDKNDKDKLRDIVNLQKEFSDVTMDVPAPEKVVKDIPSPPASQDDENIAPLSEVAAMGKSLTRSRRKLFTPRAEPLEDSPPDAGDSTERIRVPRPSYHRPRARRKL